MSAWIVNQRSGQTLATFGTYLEAAQYRAEVLRPRMDPFKTCPYAIRVNSPQRQAADARHTEYCRQTDIEIADLLVRAEKPRQLEMFGVLEAWGLQ